MINSSAIKKPLDKITHLFQILQNLPNLPGVYQMLDKSGEILYIGKAKSLKHRVSSYFSKTITHPKTKALVTRIWDIQTIIAHSESEALLLEQNLIKEHRPPYNILLRDDKSYLYLFISIDNFPKIGISRGKSNHRQNRFFGPYPSAANAKEAQVLLQKLFMLRNCTNRTFQTSKKPCLEYQIKRCSAPCAGLIDKKKYEQDVQNALAFLRGDTKNLQKTLTQKMHEASQNMNFEQAIFYRDRLGVLSEITSTQAVHRLEGEADVFFMMEQMGILAVHVLTIRQGKVLGGKTYFLDDNDIEGENPFERFLLSFYFQISQDLPKEIIVSQDLPNKQTIIDVFYQKFNQKIIIKSQVHTYRKQWLEMAELNVRNDLTGKLSDYQELQQRFDELQKVLFGICDNFINRIECFDISHTMGELAVGSCVVFDRMGKQKRQYRQYNVIDVGGDDYASMRQILIRRYKKHSLPDLLLIDGGRGQLTAAKEALQELGILSQTLLIGVAKGEGRKAGLEVLHFLNHDAIDLPKDNKALHLIMHIRDEAHRFAITNHRKKRDKARGSSILEVIPNLGAKRRRELLTHFGGISQLLGASQADIAKVHGISKTLAQTIYHALHGD